METTKETPTLVEKSAPKLRYLSIDVFRGATIVAMVFVNFVAEYSAIPWWSKHVADVGLTYVDLVAPFFIFAIALTYHQSYRRSLEQNGLVETFLKFIRRYFALLGIGLLAGMTFTPSAIIFGWSALPAIGLAGAFTFVFIRFPRKARLIIGLLLLVAYQITLQSSVVVDGVVMTISDWNLSDVHGGFIGGFGFGIMMLLGTVVCEAFETKRMNDFLWFGSIITAAGVMFHFLMGINNPLWGISKNRVSMPYILISVGLASLCFYFVWFMYDNRQVTHGSSRFFLQQGKNSLFLYLIHALILEGLSALVPVDTELFIVLLAATGAIMSVWLIAIGLDKKHIYLII